MTDWLSKWIEAYKKQIYTNKLQKERPLWPPTKNKTKRNHPQQLQAYSVLTDDVESTKSTN